MTIRKLLCFVGIFKSISCSWKVTVADNKHASLLNFAWRPNLWEPRREIQRHHEVSLVSAWAESLHWSSKDWGAKHSLAHKIFSVHRGPALPHQLPRLRVGGERIWQGTKEAARTVRPRRVNPVSRWWHEKTILSWRVTWMWHQENCVCYHEAWIIHQFPYFCLITMS